MKTSVFPARILTPPPIRLPASQPTEMRQIVHKWLELRRQELSETRKLLKATSILGYANFGATIDRSTYSLKLAFDGLSKLYEGEELWKKAYLILDHMIKSDITPFDLGPLMQRTIAVMKTAQPIGVPALLVECFKAAGLRPSGRS